MEDGKIVERTRVAPFVFIYTVGVLFCFSFPPFSSLFLFDIRLLKKHSSKSTFVLSGFTLRVEVPSSVCKLLNDQYNYCFAILPDSQTHMSMHAPTSCFACVARLSVHFSRVPNYCELIKIHEYFLTDTADGDYTYQVYRSRRATILRSVTISRCAFHSVETCLNIVT